MNNFLEHHERLYHFIKHKERVLNAKPVIDTRPRSKSMPGRPKNVSLQKKDEERRIQEANERLLKSLLKIADRKSKYQ